MMEKLKRIVMNPKRTVRFILTTLIQIFHFVLTDKFCVKMLYKIHFGKRLNLSNPQTFNEKLNWLKIYYHNPMFTKLADKYEVKQHVGSIIGQEHIVKNYGVWNSFKEVDFEQLPDQFVLKTTHDSGGVIVCRDKANLDVEKTQRVINRNLKKNFYYISWEWPYKNIQPRIIADEFLDDGRKGELQDYKFWCFNGVPKYIYITNKGKDIYENFYDMDFLPVNINHGFPRFMPEYDKPQLFDEMKKYAGLLSKDIPFVRIDFFVVNKRIYFGEYTFYDWAGLRPFKDNAMDKQLGDLIQLPKPL